MKNPLVCVPLVLLSLATLSPAQEASNPFIKKNDTTKPEPLPGVSFASLVENILVPPDLLDDWLREHPVKEDATELRAAVQGWIHEGKAKLGHTDLSHGVAGWANTHESVLEQIYPTEFEPNGAGTWPLPSAFDSRNLGQSFDAGIFSNNGTPELWCRAEFCEMISSDSYQQLIDRTRQPDDVFLPRTRAMRIGNEKPASKDPFSDRSTVDFSEPHGQNFKPGFVHLAGRFDPSLDSSRSEKLSP